MRPKSFALRSLISKLHKYIVARFPRSLDFKSDFQKLCKINFSFQVINFLFSKVSLPFKCFKLRALLFSINKISNLNNLTDKFFLRICSMFFVKSFCDSSSLLLLVEKSHQRIYKNYYRIKFWPHPVPHYKFSILFQLI